VLQVAEWIGTRGLRISVLQSTQVFVFGAATEVFLSSRSGCRPGLFDVAAAGLGS
jgi:hypothetical protein